MPAIELIGLDGLPEINQGDELGELIVRASNDAGFKFLAGDILVIAQKIVSKAEGRLESHHARAGVEGKRIRPRTRAGQAGRKLALHHGVFEGNAAQPAPGRR